MNQYHKLYTPADSVVVFIDHQPQMTFGVASIDRGTLINNVTLLAKVAKEYKVPTVLTAVETESFSGYIWPQLLDVLYGSVKIFYLKPIMASYRYALKNLMAQGLKKRSAM